jgi:hypothetical protein
MNRITLQECINVFNTNPLMQYAAVKNMEALGEWKTAKEYWLKLGRTDDANACDLIIKATKNGNAYREAVKHLSQWVDETVEQGIMTREEALKVVYPEMNRISNSIMNELKQRNE